MYIIICIYLFSDGDARFANDHTIVIHQRDSFLEPSEYDIITNATDANGEMYKIVELPKTTKLLEALNFTEGVYMNYYVGNEVVIFPIFEDPNDSVAAAILQELYPDREIKQIVFTELYKDGGIAHCVTMQQPVANTTGIPSDKTLPPYTGSTTNTGSSGNDNNTGNTGGTDGTNDSAATTTSSFGFSFVVLFVMMAGCVL